MNVLGLFLISDWLIYSTVVLSFLYVYISRKKQYWEKQNVKTHKSFPIIGTFAEVMFTPLHEMELKCYKTLGKVWGTYEGNTPVLNVADLDMIKQITVKEFHNFADRRVMPLAGKSRITRFFLTNLDGEEWKAHRSVLTPTFTSGKLKQMTGLIEDCAKEMITRVEEAKQVNSSDVEVKDIFSKYAMNVIANCCFGYKLDTANANDPFFAHAKSMFSTKTSIRILVSLIFPKIFEWFQISMFPPTIMEFFENAINDVVATRKNSKTKRNDFLQLLLEAQSDEDGGKKPPEATSNGQSNEEHDASGALERKKVMSQEAVVSHSMLFLLVGYDTTASTVSFVTYLMALNPDCQDQLAQEIQETFSKHEKLTYEVVMEMQYLDKVLSETLRLFPVAVKTERRCTRECQLGNIAIPKDMVVGIPIYSIHHDEEFYPNPEKFDPERFSPENKEKRIPFSYIPFGAGPRNCVGMRFAQIEAKMAVVQFFRQFRVSPCSKTEIPLKMQPGSGLLQPKNGIHLKIEKRQ